VAALRELLTLAERSGFSDRLLRAAAAELAELIERSALADGRRLETLERGRAVERLRSAGVGRAAICARLAINVQQYDRARRSYRELRCSDPVEASQAKATKETG